jgi:hypothetical protein
MLLKLDEFKPENKIILNTVGSGRNRTLQRNIYLILY